MAIKKKKPEKPYWRMDAKELATATREFDSPIPLSRTRPLTRAERQRFEYARRSADRSVASAGSKVLDVKLRLDERLLRRCEDYASKHKMTLSEMVARSLQSALIFAE